MDFTRKATFVAGGYTMEIPTVMTYFSVVLRERTTWIYDCGFEWVGYYGL
jgi:hypothetical protein